MIKKTFVNLRLRLKLVSSKILTDGDIFIFRPNFEYKFSLQKSMLQLYADHHGDTGHHNDHKALSKMPE